MGTVSSNIDWIAQLTARSPALQALPPVRDPTVFYRDSVSGEVLEPEAFNLASSSAHTVAFARSFEALSARGISAQVLRKYLTDLTSGRNTAGNALELLAYEWLDRKEIEFEPQIAVSGAKILNPNGSDLDGVFTAASRAYFDIKSLGFQEALVKRITDTLESRLSDFSVSAEGTWDVSAEFLGSLLTAQSLTELEAELQKATMARRDPIVFVKRLRQRVQVSTRTSNPYALAKENAAYPFKYAKQFTRTAPFVLIFASHPWLGGLALSADFANATSTFTRSLARRFFIQHLSDPTPIFGITKGEASRLVSAIGFLDVYQLPADERRDDYSPLRLYINPNAVNPLSRLTVSQMSWADPQAIATDDFAHDNY